MTHYYVDYYRDFCNTYTVYAVAPKDAERFLECFPDAERISRKEAIRLGYSRPAEAKRDGDTWPAGFCDEGPEVHYLTLPRTNPVADALEQCRASTVHAIHAKECQMEHSR